MKRTGGRRDNLVEAILQACRADRVIALGGERVVVAFSGGPDSSALLHGLRRSSRALRVELHAVHVDHGLRRASRADAAAAEAFCAEIQVPLRIVRVRPRRGSEEAARDARHQALEGAAGDLGAATIALGHTADDQVETALLHLLRGSGLEGIAAMAPREGLRFRPMLTVWRRQVEAYCARQGIEPRRDQSNYDRRFTRNRLRHELIPLLEAGYNPRAREAILRLVSIAREEHDAVAAQAQHWLRGRRGALPRASFNRLPRAVRAEALRSLWSVTAGLARPAGDAARIGQALHLVAGPGGGIMRLGAGFELHAQGYEFEIRDAYHCDNL